MLTPSQQDFLTRAAKAGVTSERVTGCPAELTVAQAIVESGWGTRMPGNNALGIKPTDHGAGSQYFASKEYLNGQWVTMPEAFEKYDSLADCFADHDRLITEAAPYRDAWEQYQQDHDLDSLIGNVARRYATDPAYGALLMELAYSPRVVVAIQDARAKAL